MTPEENAAQAELEKAAFVNEWIGNLLANDDEMTAEDAAASAEEQWEKIRAFFGGRAA